VIIYLGDGLLNCLQDANADVHEAALTCLLSIQEKNISISDASAAHLMDLLITNLFCAKRSETVESALRSSRYLLSSNLVVTLPVLLKGSISRNLSSGYQSLVCTAKSIGKEISGPNNSPLPSELLSPMIDQLLRVIATAKVGGLCYLYSSHNPVI
jgi:hypothetical protein